MSTRSICKFNDGQILRVLLPHFFLHFDEPRCYLCFNGPDGIVFSADRSYAGAFGQPQFIPSSFREYALSFDGDEQRDVFSSIPDILASIANYLHFYHWTFQAPYYVDIGSRLKGKAVQGAYDTGRKGLLEYTVVEQEQNIALSIPKNNKAVTIVGLEIDPKKGGGKRFVAGYPNFQAITEWNHSNRYAMVVSELAEAIQ